MPTSRLKRRSPRRLGAALAVAGALALVLTGCVGTAEPTPTPTATKAAPVFASDEERSPRRVRGVCTGLAGNPNEEPGAGGSIPFGLTVLPVMRPALHDEFVAGLPR